MCGGEREIQSRWVQAPSLLFSANVYVQVCFHLSHTECTVTELTDLDIPSQDEVVDPRCTDSGFMSNTSIPDGVVCYNGTNAGSRAVYICNNDTQRNNVTRVCGADGIWNGSIPLCPGIIPPPYYSSIHLECTLVVDDLLDYMTVTINDQSSWF